MVVQGGNNTGIVWTVEIASSVIFALSSDRLRFARAGFKCDRHGSGRTQVSSSAADEPSRHKVRSRCGSAAHCHRERQSTTCLGTLGRGACRTVNATGRCSLAAGHAEVRHCKIFTNRLNAGFPRRAIDALAPQPTAYVVSKKNIKLSGGARLIEGTVIPQWSPHKLRDAVRPRAFLRLQRPAWKSRLALLACLGGVIRRGLLPSVPNSPPAAVPPSTPPPTSTPKPPSIPTGNNTQHFTLSSRCEETVH